MAELVRPRKWRVADPPHNQATVCSPGRSSTCHLSGPDDSSGTIRYFTLLIHLRTGPLTEVSGDPGENTSDMWLWSLNTATVGRLPAMVS